MLRIPVDKVCMVIQLAREALGTDPPDDDPATHDGDDGHPHPSTEDYDEEPAFDGLFDYVDSLNGDELSDLLALAWLGRGDYMAEDWPQAQADADAEISDADGVAEVIQDPTLPDDLVAGMEALGYACVEDR